eukprot:5959070-Prorocentrum_lima.AAC.1
MPVSVEQCVLDKSNYASRVWMQWDARAENIVCAVVEEPGVSAVRVGLLKEEDIVLVHDGQYVP